MTVPPALPTPFTPVHRPRAWTSALLCLGALVAAPAAQAVPVLVPGDLNLWTCSGACGSSGAQGDMPLSPAGSPVWGYVTTSGSAATGLSPVALDANSRGAGTEQNGSRWVSPVFTGAAGDALDVQFNFVSTDGKGYDDYAWARLLNAGTGAQVAWLFIARSTNSSSGKIIPGDVVDKDAFDPDVVIVDFKDFEFQTRLADNPVDWAPLGGSNGACWKDNADGCGLTGWLQSHITLAAAGSFRLEVGVVNWGDSAYDSGLAFDVGGMSAVGRGARAWCRRAAGRGPGRPGRPVGRAPAPGVTPGPGRQGRQGR